VQTTPVARRRKCKCGKACSAGTQVFSRGRGGGGRLFGQKGAGSGPLQIPPSDLGQVRGGLRKRIGPYGAPRWPGRKLISRRKNRGAYSRISREPLHTWGNGHSDFGISPQLRTWSAAVLGPAGKWQEKRVSGGEGGLTSPGYSQVYEAPMLWAQQDRPHGTSDGRSTYERPLRVARPTAGTCRPRGAPYTEALLTRL